MIENQRKEYPIELQCRVLRVSRSGYYAWRRRKERLPTLEEVAQAKAVKESFYYHRRRYGARRISHDLQRKGLSLGRQRTGRLMKEQQLQAICRKRFVPRTTDSNHSEAASPNLLKDSQGEPTSWGEVIVGDITYITLRGGKFCYLAIFQDKYTRRIVGWELLSVMTAELVVRALLKAIRAGLIKPQAIVHTDRGSQYVAVAYRQILQLHSLRQSMSGRGNCYDNAQAESFFSRFKCELVEDGEFEDAATARWEAFSYIEGYYNRVRLHSAIGYKIPMEYEKELKIKEQRRTTESLVSTFT